MHLVASLAFVAKLSRKFHRTMIVLLAALATSMSSGAAAGTAEPTRSSSVEGRSLPQTIWQLVRCGVLLAIVIAALYILVSVTAAALAGASRFSCINAV